jgi:3-hydroxybutyryl-CoA dehydrogenase
MKQVGIVGSGIMGAGLAEVVARAGYGVVLRSRTDDAAQKALASVHARLDRLRDKGQLSADDHQRVVTSIAVTTDLDELATCDVVIESVVEDLATKRSLFGDLDRVCDAATILASNTSTLPVVELAMATKRPDRVCGVHFFNPAPAMPLVEIVKPITASAETISAAFDFAESCAKRPIVVEDRAGFVVNALLFPYLNSAVRMWESGTASMEAIDAAMQGGCNFPIGPFALLDLVGLDTAVAILDALYAESPEPACAAAPTLRRKVSAGQLGRKSGGGFFEYCAA